MGHERVGVLPRTNPWRKIVADISGASVSEVELAKLAANTLTNVRSRFLNIYKDSGVKAAFQFLISLTSSEKVEKSDLAVNYPEIDLTSNPSSFQLSKTMYLWVESNSQSAEYADIAKRSAADTIAIWSQQQKVQRKLFQKDENTLEVWRKASSGAGFCEVARIFFSKFTERYLNYFLEREASSVIPSVIERQNFSQNIRDHIDTISKHAFETSKITQSFAAGWYNKYAKSEVPSDNHIEQFLSLAFEKVREELWREGNV